MSPGGRRGLRVSDEVAVVTGGASGFGLALATCFAERGMRVALLDVDGERAEAEAAKLAGAIAVAVDMAKDESVQAAAQTVRDRLGRADVVVSNVGVQLFGSVERFTDEEWRWVLDVNVIGAARTARAFIPLLRAAPHGRLAFTTSSSVLSPASRLAAYQASKFAVWGLAETLRLELAGEVAVTVLFPSGMTSRHLESSTAVQPTHLARTIGEPEDFEAMAASNPEMVAALSTPEEAAANVVDAVLRSEPYAITHGDLSAAVTSRYDALLKAATARLN